MWTGVFHFSRAIQSDTMKHFAVHWGNRLEQLAEGMFNQLFEGAWPDPLMPRCIVTSTPAMQAWLRNYFVYEWSGRRGRVLANCEFALLFPFVNDWMDRLLVSRPPGTKASRREPRHHPYALSCLQWRLYRLLGGEIPGETGFEPVRAYLGEHPSPRRVFQLAGRLARLFDEYQVYRCDVLLGWERGRDRGDWQAELWRRLAAESPESYAALFRAMEGLPESVLQERFGSPFRQVALFGVTAMPAPYVSFLREVMASVAEVDIHVLNPCEENWLEDVSRRVAESRRDRLILEDHPLKDELAMVLETGHPLLASLGSVLQEHLHALEDQCGGVSDTPFVPARRPTLLATLQDNLLHRVQATTPCPAPDDSLRIHICHSPRREVEVLHDNLLRWLTVERLQPHQVQVLLPDLETYAPLVEAVFQSRSPAAAEAIPFVIEGRGPVGNTAVVKAFRAILNCATSRFSAASLLELLRGEAILAAFGLNPGDIGAIEVLVRGGGIRWGVDAAHREQVVTGVRMEAHMTWEYGLDRLIRGYAMGEVDPGSAPWPVDLAEGGLSLVLGRLARLIDELRRFRGLLGQPRSLTLWHQVLADLLDTFLLSTNATCGDVAFIRRAINDLLPLAEVAGLRDLEVPFEVINSHMEGCLGTGSGRSRIAANAVVFSALNPMNSRPAEVVCVLGLNEGDFPRHDTRPTFDLLGRSRRRGDRSPRRDDREAFLECLVNVRRYLHLSYVGRTDHDNAVMPPSIVLQELREVLVAQHALMEASGRDGQPLLPFEVLHHLNGEHPAYFSGGTLFSYSRDNLMAARQLAGHGPTPDGGSATQLRPPPLPYEGGLEVGAFARFFINPSRFYYQDMLGVQLDIGGARALEEDEPFQIDALGRYALRLSLMKVLREVQYEVGKVDKERVADRMKADALVPLGQPGIQAVEETLSGMEAWLDMAVPGNLPGRHSTVRELLQALEAAPPVVRELAASRGSGPGVVLRGQIQLATLGPGAQQVLARPSEIKLKDRIRAWIMHCFACGTREDPVWTVLLGTGGAELFRPLQGNEARREITGLVDLFQRGRHAPLPFAPESSWRYCECVPPGTAAPDRQGLLAAARMWEHGSGEVDAECADVWLYHAFGGNGPMRLDGGLEFALTAQAFYRPLFAAVGDSSVAAQGRAAR